MTNLRPKEAAALLNVSESTVYDLCAKRLIQHARVGMGKRSIRIPRGALEAYLASRTIHPIDPTIPHTQPRRSDWRRALAKLRASS